MSSTKTRVVNAAFWSGEKNNLFKIILIEYELTAMILEDTISSNEGFDVCVC